MSQKDQIMPGLEMIFRDIRGEHLLSKEGAKHEAEILDIVANNILAGVKSGQKLTMEDIVLSMRMYSLMPLPQLEMMQKLSRGEVSESKEDLKEVYKNVFKNLIKTLDKENNLGEEKVNQLAEKFAAAFVMKLTGQGISHQVSEAFLREVIREIKEELKEARRELQPSLAKDQKADEEMLLPDSFKESDIPRFMNTGKFALPVVASHANELDFSAGDSTGKTDAILLALVAVAGGQPALIRALLDEGFSAFKDDGLQIYDTPQNTLK